MIVRYGRRVPLSWKTRYVQKLRDWFHGGTQLNMMIEQSMEKSRKRCLSNSNMRWEHLDKEEGENVYFKIKWFVAYIQGSEKEEADELKDVNQLFEQKFVKKLEKIIRKYYRGGKRTTPFSPFVSKFMNNERIKRLFEKGKERLESGEKCLADQALEFGILIDVQLIRDYKKRIIIS